MKEYLRELFLHALGASNQHNRNDTLSSGGKVDQNMTLQPPYNVKVNMHGLLLSHYTREQG
jgi:hypothetical protein